MPVFKLLLMAVGLVLMLEGLPWAASPNAYKRAIHQLLKEPDAVLRGLGLAAMAAGLFLVWLGRS